MRLIQRICAHGTDQDYLPERIINSMVTLLTTKQGKFSPSEFSETASSNNAVLTDVVGEGASLDRCLLSRNL